MPQFANLSFHQQRHTFIIGREQASANELIVYATLWAVQNLNLKPGDQVKVDSVGYSYLPDEKKNFDDAVSLDSFILEGKRSSV